MKAWRIEKHGGPEALKSVDLPQPQPGPMEALVRVEAVGLNHLDLWVRKGVPGHSFHLPIIPGGDISGVIAELGPGGETALADSAMKIGSPVILNPGISCGRCEACLSGFDPLCRSYGILGETRDGGCAEFVVVPVANLIPRPPQLTAAEGASLSIAYLTAWSMVTRKAQVRPGEVILIQAGGSGVSVAAIQMAKMFGATVITTVGSDSKIEKARQLGADYVIQYGKTPFRDEVKKILSSLGKKGCEVVIDHVGSETFSDSFKCLGWGGRWVTCGATSGGKVELDLKAVFFKNISILGTTMGSKADLIRIVQLVAEKKIRSVIHKAWKFSDLPQAFEQMENRETFGKTVLTLN